MGDFVRPCSDFASDKFLVREQLTCKFDSGDKKLKTRSLDNNIIYLLFDFRKIP